MSRKRIVCALLILALLLTGCAKSQEEKWELRLFYPAPEYEAGGDVLHSQAVDWSQQEGKEAAEQVKQVVSLLLNKDGSMDFPSPLPQGTELLRCSVSGGIATLDLTSRWPTTASPSRLPRSPVSAGSSCWWRGSPSRPVNWSI